MLFAFAHRRRAGEYPPFSFSDVAGLLPALPRDNVCDCVKTMAHNGYIERVSLILWRVVSKVKRQKEQEK